MQEFDYIRVVLKDMPVTIQAFAFDDGFGFYTIIINSRLSKQMQIEAYEHELRHISNGDFLIMRDVDRDINYDTDVNKIESEQHKS